MVESRIRFPKPERDQSPRPLLKELLAGTDFNLSEQKAIEIIKGLESDPEQGSLLFLYHVWHETGTLSPFKSILGIKNNRDVLGLISRVMDSDELTEKYDDFYKLYKLGDNDEE